jgi:hypothetical protein
MDCKAGNIERLEFANLELSLVAEKIHEQFGLTRFASSTLEKKISEASNRYKRITSPKRIEKVLPFLEGFEAAYVLAKKDSKDAGNG